MALLLRAGPFSARDDGGRLLFGGVTVRLEERKLVVLDGSSGSGKSTLLRQLAGLDDAPGAVRRLGEVTFGGRELPRWRAEVTLLSQDAPTLPGTVEENLRFPFRQRAGTHRAFDPEHARRLLDEVGLGVIGLGRDVRTLSGGERHRVALVRGILWSPTVLVADEPLGGLDTEAAERCFDLLAEFARRADRAVLCTLHDPSLAWKADERVGIDARKREGSRWWT